MTVRATILGVPVDNVDEMAVLDFVAGRIAGRRPAHIATVNAEYVMAARRHADFRRALLAADLCTPDGMGVVLAARRRGVPIRGRVGGSDLIWSLSELAAQRGYRIFLLGGREGVAHAAADRLASTNPGLRVVGTLSGNPHDDNGQISMINEAHPDILFVAFGAPAQDLWIARNRGALDVPVSMGVGGAFDYIAGCARRAPRLMGNSGFEWLWRLIQEPWRWRRMLVLPEFALLSAVRGD